MFRVLAEAINSVFGLFYILILVRCLLSFIRNIDWYKQPWKLIREVTEPYLELFRRIIPPIGMIDISPIVAIIALGIIQNLVIMLLSLFTTN